MADFQWSDLALLWPLLPFIGAALFAWGSSRGYRKATGDSAAIIKRQRQDIERYHSEINDLIDRLPAGTYWPRPGVYVNPSETQH